MIEIRNKYKSFLFFLGFVWLHCRVKNIHAVEYYKEKPEWIKTCRIYQPEFTKCSTESIQILINRLVQEEIPEVKDRFGPIDPLKIDQIIFNGDNNQAVTIKANLTDIVVKGFSKMVIKENRVSKKDFSWLTKIFLPKFRLDGQYKMSGKILFIPLNGAGNIFFDLDNLDILMNSKTQLYEKDGLTFYNVTKIQVNISISGARSHLDNIFNGNSKEVEESTNQFFNDNWREFFEALRPIINETVERIFLNIMKSTFDLLPAKFFIDDIPTSSELYGRQ